MRLAQIITDYIRRSILTTQGDLAVRGASQPERLAAGLLKTFLAGQGVGEIPAYEGHKLSDHGIAIGSFTRSTAGNQVISGLTFRPSLVFFFTTDAVTSNRNDSIGVSNIDYKMMAMTYNDGADSQVYTNYALGCYRDGSNDLLGNMTGISADGFTVTFTLTGAASAVIVWLAIE